MEKQDFIHIDNNGYKVHLVSLIPDNPKRILFIPPLVGANGILAIKTFRYFFRKGCILMSFDYCGHYKEIANKFTLKDTFRDTRSALAYVNEYSQKIGLPIHVVGACYGLIPLIVALNDLHWPKNVKTLISVNGLLSINDLLNFDDYKPYLEKKGVIFKKKSDFINFILAKENDFINGKQKYIAALTEYLSNIFVELLGTISDDNFGILEYSNVDCPKSLCEFLTIDLPVITVPKHIPCLVFSGVQDFIFNLQLEESKKQYLDKFKKLVPHGLFRNIRIDHFGKGEDHYLIGKEGVDFLTAFEAS